MRIRRVQIRDFQSIREADIELGPVTLIVGRNDVGKCHIGTDTVVASDGRLIRIDQIAASNVPSLGPDWVMCEKVAGPTISYGSEECLRVVTASGYEVTVTESHPLLTIDGWKEASALQPQDHIATARRLSVEGRRRLPDWIPEFAGLMIGDGDCVGVRFTSNDPDLQCVMAKIAHERGWRIRRTLKRKALDMHGPPKGPAVVDLAIAKSTAHGRGPNADSPRYWLRRLGLFGLRSREKCVPAEIFTAPNDQVARFLGCYFACDGGIAKDGRVLQLWSTSRDLLQGVKHLLLRFGIVSRLTPKIGRYRGEPHFSWKLTIGGKFAKPFVDQIPVPGRKAERLQLVKEANPIRGWDDLVPNGWQRWLRESPSWHEKRGGHWGRNTPRGTSRGSVLRAAKAEKNRVLLAVANSDIFWDRVIAVEAVGAYEVFSPQVPDTENFIADGGVISHNSAVLRAIRAALENRSGGDKSDRGEGFIRRGASAAGVSLEFEDGSWLHWTKPRRGGGEYRLVRNGEETQVTRAGRDLPDVITDLTGIRPIEVDGESALLQFATQFDAPFLLASTGGQAAKLLSRVTRMDRLIMAQVLARREMERAKKAAGEAEGRVSALDGELAQMPDYQALLARWQALDGCRCELEERRRELEEANRLAAELAELHRLEAAWRGANLPARASALRDDATALVALQQAVAGFLAAHREAKKATGEAEAARVKRQRLEDELHEALGALERCPLCGQEMRGAGALSEVLGEVHADL